jgi:beta-phosphoglucomutase
VIGPDDVAVSKPHPEVFLKAANRLGIPAEICVVFEDSPKGIEAAARAGMKAIGVTSNHTSEEN